MAVKAKRVVIDGKYQVTPKMYEKLCKIINENKYDDIFYKDLQSCKIETIKQWNSLMIEYSKLHCFNKHNKFEVKLYNEHIKEHRLSFMDSKTICWYDNQFVEPELYNLDHKLIDYKEFFNILQSYNKAMKTIKINKETRIWFHFKPRVAYISSVTINKKPITFKSILNGTET